MLAVGPPSPPAGEGLRVRGRRGGAVLETRASRRDPSSGQASPGHFPLKGGRSGAPSSSTTPSSSPRPATRSPAPGFVEAVKARLLPLVDCLTPNLAEAAALIGAPLARDEAEMARQGAALMRLGPRAVLMKGGHLAGAEAVDLLVTADAVRRFAAPRVASPNLHGTGCTLSSAIAAQIALGASLPEAVAAAKDFVGSAIERGRDATLGAGAGPLLQLPLREARRQ